MKNLITLLKTQYIGYHGSPLKEGDIVSHASMSGTIKWRLVKFNKTTVTLAKYSFGSADCNIPLHTASRLYST